MPGRFVRRCFALCCVLCCGLVLFHFARDRSFMGCRVMSRCFALCGLLGCCLPLRQFTCCRFFTCSRFFGRRGLVSCFFAYRVLAGNRWVRRTNLITRREVIPRQQSLRPRHGFSFRHASSLRRRHATLTPTHPKRGQQSDRRSANCSGKPEVHRRQIEVATLGVRTTHSAGTLPMRLAGSNRRTARNRGRTVRLSRLRWLAADAMLLQLHQHPAF